MQARTTNHNLNGSKFEKDGLRQGGRGWRYVTGMLRMRLEERVTTDHGQGDGIDRMTIQRYLCQY